MLLRDHAGKASFRDPELREVSAPQGGVVFDGVPVVARGVAAEGFQVRDVAAGGDFVRIGRQVGAGAAARGWQDRASRGDLV